MNQEKKKNKKRKSAITGTIKIDLIKSFMEEKGLTETQFAEICGISVKELQKVLDDFSDFEPISFLRIAKRMGLEFVNLLN